MSPKASRASSSCVTRRQRAHRERPHAAGQLAGAEDGGLARIHDVAAAGIGRATGRASDPARIEDRAVVALELVGARSLDEERAPLVEEGLERRQVHFGGIGFHLAEVRIDRAGERQRLRDRVLQVEADRAAGVRRLEQRVARAAPASWRPARARRAPARAACRPAAAPRPPARRTTTRSRWRRAAAAATSRSPAGEPPRARCANPSVASPPLPNRSWEYGIRNSAHQPSRVAPHRDVPHRVPALVVVVVVEAVLVALHARRIDDELVGRPPIVRRVDEHPDPVGGGIGVTPRQERQDAVGLAVEGADADVDGDVVEEDAGLGAVGGRRALGRLALDEIGDRRSPRAQAASDRSPSRRMAARGTGGRVSSSWARGRRRRRAPTRRPAGPRPAGRTPRAGARALRH